MSDEYRINITARSEAEGEISRLQGSLRNLRQSLVDTLNYAGSGGAVASIQQLNAAIETTRTQMDALRRQFNIALPEEMSRLREVTRIYEAQNATRQRSVELAYKQTIAEGEATAARLRASRDSFNAIMAGRAGLPDVEAGVKRLRAEQEFAALRAKVENDQMRDAAVYYAQVKANEAVQRESVASIQAAAAAHARLAASTRQTATGLRETADGFNIANREGRHVVALFDELQRNQRGQMFSTFGAMLRDSGAGMSTLIGGLAGLAALGIGFRVTQDLTKWGEELGKLAEHQENVAAAVGISVPQFVAFSGALRLTGGSADSAARTLETLQRRMEEAVKAPTGPAMSAFRDMGLTWDEMLKRLRDPQGVMSTLMDISDYIKRIGGDAERTSRIMEVFGGRQQFMEIVSAIKGGAQNFHELNAAAAALNPFMVTNHEALVSINKDINELSVAWEGFKASVTSGEYFRSWVQGLETLIVMMDRAGEKAIQVPDAVNKRLEIMRANRGLDLSLDPYGLYSPYLPAGGQAPRRGGRADESVSGEAGTSLVDPLNKLAGVDADLAIVMKEATKALPPGYSVRVSGGFATGGHAPDSMHYKGEAVDFTIYDEAGKALGHAAAKVIGSDAYNVYKSYGDAFKAASAGRGRSGMDFGKVDPGHVDFGLSYGAAPGSRAGEQSPFDLGVAEKLYQAELNKAKVTAEQTHNYAEQNRLLQQQLNFDKMSVDEKEKFLRSQLQLGGVESKARIDELKTGEQILRLRQQETQYNQNSAVALLHQQEIEAGRRGDLATVVKLRQEEAALVKADPYATQAQKTQADTRVLEANINLQREAVRLAQERYSIESKSSADILRGFEASIQEQVKAHVMSQADAYRYTEQEVARLNGYLREMLDLEMKAADAVYGVAEAGKGSVDQTRIWGQEWELGVKNAREMAQLQEKITANQESITKKWAEPWVKAFDTIGSALENAITGVLSKKTTWKQAEVQVATAVGEGILKAVASTASKAIAQKLFSATAGEGLDAVFGKFIEKGIGSLFNIGTETATKTSAEVTGATAAAPILSTSLVTGATIAGPILTAAMAAGAGGGGAGAAIGEVAAVALAAAGGMVVPSYAGGGMVNGGQLSILHPREMVLPEHLSQGMQEMINSGSSGDNHLHIHANVVDAPGVQRWFKEMLNDNADAFRGLIRNNSVRSLSY